MSATPNSVVRPLVAFSYEKSLMHTLPLYFETGLGIAGYGTSISDGAGEAQRLLFRGAGTGQLAFRFDGRRLVDSLSGSEYARRLRRQGEVRIGKGRYVRRRGFDRFDMGVRAGIGVEYRRYSFRFGYDAGFLNLSDVSDVTVRNKTFLLQLGYRF